MTIFEHILENHHLRMMVLSGCGILLSMLCGLIGFTYNKTKMEHISMVSGFISFMCLVYNSMMVI